MTTRIDRDVATAAALLQNDEVVAIPTETVYGLAGNALSPDVVKKIFAIKNRPLSNPLILHLADFNQLDRYATKIPPAAAMLAERFWPGPLTLLLPKTSCVPDVVTAGLPRVAVRIPSHPVALQLLRRLHFPLAAPSANPFGYISPTSAEDVRRILHGKISYVLDGGDCAKGIESTIVGFEGNTPVIYRPGVVTAEEIKALVGAVEIHRKEPPKPLSPGMLPSHYAPHTPLFLTESVAALTATSLPPGTAILAFQQACLLVPKRNQQVLSPRGTLSEAAANLYKALHRLDGLKCQRIIAEQVPDTGIGKAINDRLRRAAYASQHALPGVA